MADMKTGDFDRKVTAKEKAKQALELRRGGASYEQIKNTVGFSSVQYAHKVVTKALNEIPKEAAESLRDLELARLDEMTLRLTAQFRAGNLDVVTKMLRVMEQRAKLTGIYQLPEGSGDLTSVAAMFGGLMASAQTFAQAYGEDGAPLPSNPDEAPGV
jgi:hypothetical protein